MNIFKRDFTPNENRMMCEAFDRIVKIFREHIANPDYVYRYFHAKTKEQKHYSLMQKRAKEFSIEITAAYFVMRLILSLKSHASWVHPEVLSLG